MLAYRDSEHVSAMYMKALAAGVQTWVPTDRRPVVGKERHRQLIPNAHTAIKSYSLCCSSSTPQVGEVHPRPRHRVHPVTV